MKTFDIILTTFNRVEYTRRTVGSLIKSGALEKCQRFIVVDNGSTEEGMESFLNSLMQFQKVFIIRRSKNDGWGSAVNDALGLSRAEYVFISNNDVEYTPDFMERMFSVYEKNPGIGILGVWRHTAHGFTGYQGNDFLDMTDVPAVGWLIPKDALEKVGMFPEKGPCLTKGGNGEDSDMVQRMKAVGFLVGVPTEDVAIHIDGY